MGKKSGGNESKYYREQEQARQARIREGTARIDNIFDSQFTPDYFDRQQQNYMSYATPQLNDQYADANKKLLFALDRSGQLEGSSRASLGGELQKKYDLSEQKIKDDALAYKTQAMSSTEDARSNLISTLNATGDADAAAKSAIARSQALSQPPAYSPLTQMFADFTSVLGTQAAAERANSYTGSNNYATYNTGWFGPRAGSVSVRS